MMEPLTPINALGFFEKNLPQFLSKDEPRVKDLISELKNALQGGTSDNFHANLLKRGKALTEHIIIESIGFLSDKYNSPRDRAIDSVRAFIEKFTNFEELLFGLDYEYRDHTLHSLWVYLFGHQWIVHMGGYGKIQIAGQMNIIFTEGGKPLFVLLPSEPIRADIPHLEAMWGMIAVLHDLGYPVETISTKANEIFGGILDPFAIDFSSIFQIDIGSRIAVLHQNVCDLVSTMYRPEGLADKNEREKLVRQARAKKERNEESLPFPVLRNPTIAKDEALEIEFKIAWVNKNHSAWSATFAFKNIPCLHESDYHGGGPIDYLKLLTRRDIIYSILHHTSQEPKDEAVNRFQFILLFIDEIEECARYGKGGVPRGITSDYCDLHWDFNKEKLELRLDYSHHKYWARDKYIELAQKFRAQTSGSGNYEIEIQFLDEKDKDIMESLKLSLTKDSGSVLPLTF
jgi:hypothetical protein